MKKFHLCTCWILISSFILQFLIIGCGSNGLLRVSPYFGSGIYYPEPQNIGNHGYKHGGCNGMLYTCRGGYIDLGHLRESADRTKFIFEVLYPVLLRSQEKITFRIVEPEPFHITIKYPYNWKTIPISEKQTLAKEKAIELSEYIAHKSTIWHEIITWYGWSCVGIFSEKPSSFSWEDIYSDALGADLGAKALEASGDFNSNMTRLLNEKLLELNAQAPSVARAATRKIRGSWFEGGPYPFITMKKRNFGVGLDGIINPWLVPEICNECNPIPIHTHNLTSTSTKDFSFKVEIEPVCLQGHKAAGIASKVSRISPDEDYPKIIRQIRNEAIQERGPNVDKPY
ncbi:MAG: DUF4056 domain-containing protein [Candidatus Nanoarchaeia archaeon]